MTREEIEVEKFGAIFGVHLSRDQLDKLAFSKISNPKHCEGEAALFETKWFDYRFMHPVAATYVFARAYRDVFARLYRRHFDHSVDRDPFWNTNDVFDLHPSVVTGLYRARQHADACGIPYPYYVEFVMEAGMRYKRKALSRPSQCYQPDAIKVAIKEWEQRLGTRMFIAKDPRFRLNRYRGLASQLAHIRWVLEQCSRRPNPAEALAICFKENVLPARVAAAKFGQPIVERALQIAAI